MDEEDNHDYVFGLFSCRQKLFVVDSSIMFPIRFMSFVLFLSSVGVPLP